MRQFLKNGKSKKNPIRRFLMNHKTGKSLLLFVLLVTLSMIIQSSIYASENPNRKPWEVWNYEKEKPVRGGTYIMAATTEVGLFNANHWPIMDWVSILFFYDALFAPDGSRRAHPFLVESYEYLDNLTIELKFQQGVKFHDGTDFDAMAFKTQMEYIKDRKNGCWSRGMLSPIESMEILDKYTVRLKFNKPWVNFVSAMGDPPGWMISPKVLKGEALAKKVESLQRKLKTAQKKAKKAAKKAGKGNAKADQKAAKLAKKIADLEKKIKKAEEKASGLATSDKVPVGTGKWIFDSYSPGNKLKVKRNPNWWYGKSVGHPDMPYFDARITVVIPDMAIQLANLRAGTIHEMSGLDKSLFRRAKQDPKLNISARPLYATQLLKINHNIAALKDIRVRRAISLAIDRKALVHGIHFGLATPATSFFPHDHWARNKTMAPREYNPEKAKALLAEAGYKDGLILNQGIVVDFFGLTNIGEPIRGMLAKVGIKWESQVLTMGAASDRIVNLEFDLVTESLGILGPQTYLWRAYHPTGASNNKRINHEKLTRMLETAGVEMDINKRKQIYHDIDKLLYDEVIDIFLTYEYALTAMSSNVMGYDREGMIKWDFLHSSTHPLWFKDGKP